MDAQALSYAQRRALNIARNAERMRAIGLTTIQLATPSPVVPAQKHAPVPKGERLCTGDGGGGELSGDLHLRRSGRTAGKLPMPLFLRACGVLMPSTQASLLPTTKMITRSKCHRHLAECARPRSKAKCRGSLLLLLPVQAAP